MKILKTSYRRFRSTTTTAPALFVIILLTRPADAEALYHKPVYNPLTKSYFELVEHVPGSSLRGPGVREAGWRASKDLATNRSFEGVKGRLAVVKTKQVNDFLRKTFRPDTETWIGLRYLCRFNKLQWVTGEFHPLNEYSNWDRVWNIDGTKRSTLRPTCQKGTNEYWPVHYWSVAQGFRWNANGTVKEFYAYFVEYPTGRE